MNPHNLFAELKRRNVYKVVSFQPFGNARGAISYYQKP